MQAFTLLLLKTVKMKVQPKNLLLIIINGFCVSKKQKALMCFLFLYINILNAQITNYVNNGGFEIPRSNNSQKPKYWDAIDSTKFLGLMYSYTISPYLVPLSSITYQWPKSGNAWFGTSLLFKPNTTQTLRGYPRNALKSNLQFGKTYCVKFYCNVTNQSSYGVDGLGAYFGDNTTDTITQCSKPIAYLNPQVQNPTGNIITDTLNWVLMTGTFVANGTEKYMIIGNFKSDALTNSLMINPTNLPTIGSDILLDDVSCIPLDLPAYAGPDIYGIPTTTVYLGRAQDVGIDEACMWYHLPSTTTAIDTAAGITVTVATTTQTYMVKQDICGVIKYDTVVVYASALGLNDLRFNIEDLRFYPNPTTNELNIEFINVASTSSATELQIEIYNSLGQILREEEITFKENKAIINTKELANGVYVLSLFDPAKNDKLPTVSKRFVIAR
jgi:hypothetical protein